MWPPCVLPRRVNDCCVVEVEEGYVSTEDGRVQVSSEEAKRLLSGEELLGGKQK